MLETNLTIPGPGAPLAEPPLMPVQWSALAARLSAQGDLRRALVPASLSAASFTGAATAMEAQRAECKRGVNRDALVNGKDPSATTAGPDLPVSDREI